MANMLEMYQQMLSGQTHQQTPNTPQMSGAIPQRPLNVAQRIGIAIQAMRNPAAFARQQFPDVPDQYANDPGQFLNYIMQTRNISQEQVNQVSAQYPMGRIPGN
jgi:hypothetical protein